MKICWKEKQHPVRNTIITIVLLLLCAGLYIGGLIIPEGIANLYSRHVFPVIAFFFNSLTNIVYISISENIVVVGSIALIFLLTAFIVVFIAKTFKGGALKFLGKVIRVVLTIVLVMLLIYEPMLGINYRRTPAYKTLFGNKKHDYTYEECVEALAWAYNGMITARTYLGQDYSGVAHMSTGYEDMVVYSNSLLEDFSKKYSLGLSENYIRAKAVSQSHYWSFTGIVGMYDPFLGEANINTDYLDITSFPTTLTHELVHAKGYARETDCEVIANLACLSAKRPEFSYAGFYHAYIDLAYIVFEYAKETGKDLPVEYYAVPAEIRRDIQARDDYWTKIEEEKNRLFNIDITEVSNNANNAFLEANGQEGGVDTYQVPRDNYLDFYHMYVRGNK